MTLRVALLVACLAQISIAAPKVPVNGVVNLPYIVPDGKSPAWVIQNGGWIQQRRLMVNDNIYNQTGMLNIDQNNPNPTSNQARVEPKTGEVIMENFQPVNGVQVARRVQIRREDDLVRCVDVFKNVGGADVTVTIQYTSSLNRGVQMAQTISDQKKTGDLAWVAPTMGSKTAVDIFAGKGAQTAGQVQWEQGNNMMQYNLQLEVPAGKSVAFMHLHAIAASAEKGAEMVNTLKASRIARDLPPEIRKAIVNFPVNRNYVGDREILRGTLFDVVETRGGDSYFGTLQEKTWKLQTMFGAIELPAEKVVGLINVGQFRPRQLLVSTEGEMMGGTLASQSIKFQLGSGQTLQIPLAQVSRIGYRKRADEPDEWKFDKPMVILQSGDRMNIQMPEQTIDVVTRYGALKLAPSAISFISLIGEDHGVHSILLNNGSHFAGLVSSEQLALKLASTAMEITLPITSVARLQFSPEQPDVPDDAATLSLSGGDVLVAAIQGDLNLVTAFDAIKIPATQIRAMSRVKDSVSDVQITLWDQTKLSGQLEEPAVACKLKDGMTIKIPVPLIEGYSQPSPLPSDEMVKRIKLVVAQLSADDWKARDQAQAELVGMGATVLPMLKQLRIEQGPEAQQRIDVIVKQFEKPGASAAPRVPE